MTTIHILDRIFQSTQDIALNEKAIASAENTVRQCEEELVTLKKIEGLKQSNMFWSGNRAKEQRARYLEAKMLTAQLKQEDLEKQNVELKKVLAKGRQTPSKSLS